MSHALRFADPSARPSSVVLDGARYACEALLRCPSCGLVVAHYRDPDARGVAPRAAHGLDVDETVVEVEILGRTPKRTRVRFLADNPKGQRGDVRLVAHDVVRMPEAPDA